VALSGIADTGRSRFGVCTDFLVRSTRMCFWKLAERRQFALAVFRLSSHPGGHFDHPHLPLSGGGSCVALSRTTFRYPPLDRLFAAPPERFHRSGNAHGICPSQLCSCRPGFQTSPSFLTYLPFPGFFASIVFIEYRPASTATHPQHRQARF